MVSQSGAVSADVQIRDILKRRVTATPDATAFVFDDLKVSWTLLTSAIGGAVAWLDELAPQGPRTKIALHLDNSPEWPVWALAAAVSGRTVIPLNTKLSAAELGYQLHQSGSDIVIDGPWAGSPVELAVSSMAAGPIRSPRLIRGSIDQLAAADAEKVNSVFALPDVPADQRFIIQYTSGTTSRPKGVVLTRRKVQQNALGVIGRLHVGPADRIASVSPFFHTAGTSAFLFVSLLSGAQLYTLVGFEPERVLQLIEKERVSVYVGVETLFTGLAKSPGFSPERVESIRTGWTTGSVEGLRYIHEVMGIPGIVNVFGMTEAAPVACMPDSHDPVEVRRTSGYPLPDTHIRVVDPSTGRLCEDGQPGLIEILGPCVTEGYYDKPQETADAFTSDGWLKSGDRGVIDTDGNLVYLGRDKDILRVGGENVAPAEVEQALLEYDDVTGAAVLGKPHDLLEEVPVAFITVRPGHTVDLARLAEFLSVRLASFKVPRTVKVVAEFPMTGSQKIKKYELRGLIDD